MTINKLLQYVQDAYAALTELSMIIVDHDGNPVTKVSNITELAELVLFVAKKGSLSFFCPREPAVDGWQRPVVVPVGHLGVKSIIAPVVVDGKAEYWIWAGAFVEEETKWLICEQPLSDAREWASAIEQANALPAWAVEAKLGEIEKMAAICGELICSERRKQKYNEYGQLLKAAVTDRSALNGVDKLLHQLRKMDERLDMALYIGKHRQGWLVTATSGEKAGQLYGKAVDELFPPLSSPEMSRYPAYFQDAALDPRFSFLVRHGIRPKAMVVYPAMYEEKLEGWVIVGSETASSLPDTIKPLGAVLVQHWHLLAKCETANMKMNRHFMRLAMLMEIGRAMRVVQKEEEIVRMMAEFAIELAYGDFVCAIWCGDGKAVTVHEGEISAKMLSCYRDDVLRRYSRGIAQSAKSHVPTLRQVGDKTVMEVPFFSRDGHFGVLAVHLKETDEAKEAEVYMTALVSVGMMMMNSAAQAKDGQTANVQMLSEQLTAREMDVLELLVQGCSNREISERLFISVHTVKNHITNIFQKIGVNDRSQLIALVYQLSHRRQRH
ncbi:LuxR family transcriptional regulator [Geobacillus genomosp. 3]|uniref:LuxR family transcriptional regulator n=1 Tax=Geobacillus genomosp. 3 TaxID=1921421 RepID=S5YVP6_GEOG3|nr:LuxR family transcriptional regulator [Geobacillus genomosp. 3]